jgi:hypothetical protein
MTNTIEFWSAQFCKNFRAAKAGTLEPLPDHGFDVCRCGAIRAKHVGQNNTCPASRADSTETFRQ